MTSDEVWDLLELIASIDRRKVGLTDRQTWEGLVGDLPAADAQAAVVAHYRESREWIMPADVRTRVRATRRERLSREILPAPPHELTDEPGRYRAVIQAGLKRIADGFSIRRAIEPGPTALPLPVAEVRKALGPAIPPAERHLPPEEIARRQVAESRAARVIRATVEPDEGEPAA